MHSNRLPPPGEAMPPSTTINFAAGLEQFGTLGCLDWDEEFEELASSDLSAGITRHNAVIDHEEPDWMTSTKPDESGLFGANDGRGEVCAISLPSSKGQTCPDRALGRADHARPASPNPDASSDRAVGSFAAPKTSDGEQIERPLVGDRSTHPGWSTETPSWYEHTSTSPELCRWAVSPGIFQDMKHTLDSCKYSDFPHRDVARVGSCLLRAIQHIYEVPLTGEVAFPRTALGEKASARHCFPRGAMGLKEPCDHDVPTDVFVPNGIEIRAPGPAGKAFYPRPSRLSHVVNVEGVNDEDEANTNTQVEKTQESGKVIIPASDDDDRISVQPYDMESDNEDDEKVECSFEEKIEANFDLEINGGSLPSDVVDEDDKYFYFSSELPSSSSSTSWPSSPPLPHTDLDSPITEKSLEIDELPVLGATAGPLCYIPGLGSICKHDEALPRGADAASDAASVSEDCSEYEFEDSDPDGFTAAIGGCDIDRAMSQLDSMSVASDVFGDAEGLSESGNDTTGTGGPGVAESDSKKDGEAVQPIDRSSASTHEAPPPSAPQLDQLRNSTVCAVSANGSAEMSGKGFLRDDAPPASQCSASSFIQAAVAAAHTAWELSSLNPLSVFLF